MSVRGADDSPRRGVWAPPFLGYRGGQTKDSPAALRRAVLHPIRPNRSRHRSGPLGRNANGDKASSTKGERARFVGHVFPPRARNTPGSLAGSTGGEGRTELSRVVYAADEGEAVTSTASGAPAEISTLRGLARSATGMCSVSTPWS